VYLPRAGARSLREPERLPKPCHGDHTDLRGESTRGVYAFDEGTGATTAGVSSYSNTDTLVNATWTTSGKHGNALSFDGSTARVTVADTNSLDLVSGITVEAWVYQTARVAGWGLIADKAGAYTLATAGSGETDPPPILQTPP
jgi:hypothetical protein